MGKNLRFLLAFFWILLGIVLCVCNSVGWIDDFWFSMGLTLMIVGGLQVIRNIRYRTNEIYREKYDTASKDERNRFLANKAWAWAGYLFVLTGGVGTIAFKLMGREDLMMMASTGVCLMIIFYWVSFLILSRKY